MKRSKIYMPDFFPSVTARKPGFLEILKLMGGCLVFGMSLVSILMLMGFWQLLIN